MDKFAFIKKFFEQDIAFDRHLGLVVDEVSEGRAVCHLPYRPELLGDPFRPALHGGVTSMLVDVAAGIAAISTLPFGSRCSTVDLRVDYLRPAGPHDLWAHAEVLRTGTQVAVVEVSIRQYSSEPFSEVARGRAAYALRPQFAQQLTPEEVELASRSALAED